MNVKLVDVVPTHDLVWRNCLMDGQVIAGPAVKPKTKTQQMRLRGILHVAVHTAVNLNLSSSSGNQLFVELECGKETLNTTMCSLEGDPAWDEVFPIPFDIEADTAAEDNSDLLTVSVMNKKLLANTLCGKVTILLKDLAAVYYKRRLPAVAKNEVIGDWFQLSKDSGWKVGGFIRLSFIFEAAGVEAVKLVGTVPETDWEESKKIDKCPLCSDAFLLLNRRHHCRKCGGVVCDKCSQYRMILEAGQSKQRVCDKCNPNKGGLHLEIIDENPPSANCKCGEPFGKADEMFCSRCGTARPTVEPGKKEKEKEKKEKRSRIGSVFGKEKTKDKDKEKDKEKDNDLAEREAKLVQQEELVRERLKELETKQAALKDSNPSALKEEIAALERKLAQQEKEEAKKVKTLDSQLQAAQLSQQDALMKCEELQAAVDKLRSGSSSDLTRIQSQSCLSENGVDPNSEMIQELESQLHTLNLEREQLVRERERKDAQQKQESLLLQQTIDDLRLKLSALSTERDQIHQQRQQLATIVEQKAFDQGSAAVIVEQAVQDTKRQLEAAKAERDALAARLASVMKAQAEERTQFESQLDDYKSKCQRAEARAADLERGTRAPAIDSGIIGAEIARAVTAAMQASGPAKTCGKCLRCGKTFTARNVTKFCSYHPGRYDWTGEKQFALGRYVCCKGGQKSLGCKKEASHNFE